jgi:hypothetical protein
MTVVEDTNETAAQKFEIARARTDRRLVDSAGRGQLKVAEVRLVAGPSCRSRYI